MEEKQAGFDTEAIGALLRLVDENALAELTVEDGELTVTVKAEGAVQGMAPVAMGLAPLAPEAGDAVEAVPSIQIQAPMTGVFYRAPAPGEPTFVEVGDVVEVGQVIGLIEAMKVFSEVPADVAGRILEIPAKNGELVQQGQTLIVLAEDEDNGA